MVDHRDAPNPPPVGTHIALATLSFAVCFAAWGMVAAFAPHFRDTLQLSATRTALLVAVPVLLGALARIPMGLLADRFGARWLFAALMIGGAAPVAAVPATTSYETLVAVAFLLGFAGSSFAVGVGYVSRWARPEAQGAALEVYGLGNAGHSAAVFVGPLIAAWLGPPAVFRGMAAALVAWGIGWAVLARDAPPADIDDEVQTFGGGVTWKVLPEKLDLRLSGSFQRVEGNNDLDSPPGGTPDVAVDIPDFDDTRLLTLGAELGWQASKAIRLSFGGWFENYELRDSATTNIKTYLPGSIFLAANDADYRAHVLYARAAYAW